MQLVINWDVTPSDFLAMEHQALSHPLFKDVAEIISVGDAGEKLIKTRIPLDPADAELDENGFRKVPRGMEDPLTGELVSVGIYPLWDTSVVELGRIGGAGLRMYFSIVKLLAMLCLGFGVFSIPTIMINIGGVTGGGMYAQDSAAGFSKAYFVRTTMGNIRAPLEDIDAGRVPELWLASFIDVVVCLAIVAVIITTSRNKTDLVEETDFSMVTMGDYSVWITPGDLDVAWKQFGKRQEDTFVIRLKRWLETTIKHRDGTGVQVADIVEDGKRTPAIWVAWDEDENIVLWNAKLHALYALESALAVVGRHPQKASSANDWKLLQAPLAKLEVHHTPTAPDIPPLLRYQRIFDEWLSAPLPCCAGHQR